MMALINGYRTSCDLAKKRIHELTAQRNGLLAERKKDVVEDLDLNRRIRLLYDEYEQMQEIIEHLTSYMMWTGARR